MIKRNHAPKRFWAKPHQLLAFGLGSGAAPYAPGTFGTLAAIPFYILLAHYTNHWAYAAITVVLFIFGVWLCDRTERDIGSHDHSGIVWDEFIGYFVTMFMVPLHWWWVIAGFLLFRLFDVWKPFPVRQIERRYGGGFGVMIDDVVAGIYAAIVLQLLILGLAYYGISPVV